MRRSANRPSFKIFPDIMIYHAAIVFRKKCKESLRRSACFAFSCLTILTWLGSGSSLANDQGIAQNEIGKAFQVIQNVGQGVNTGSGNQVAVKEACNLVMGASQDTLNSMEHNAFSMTSLSLLDVRQICALTQNNSAGLSNMATLLGQAASDMVAQRAVSEAQQTGLPYLSRVELEGSILGGKSSYSLTTVQPFWEDTENGNFLFNQMSWYHSITDTDDGNPDNTINMGLAYRKLLLNNSFMLGGNIFFDHQFDQNHNRMSIGMDAQTSLYGMAVNHYIPLSGWKTIDSLREARAQAGWDVELSGRLPDHPEWTLFTKGFTWKGYDDHSDTYGYASSLEWSPFSALVLSAGIQDENKSSPEAKAAVRLKLNFGESLGQQFNERTDMGDMSSRVWDKVRRENIIQTQLRERLVTDLQVIQTVGVNTVTTTAVIPLSVGLTFSMPATINVANTVGSVAQLRLIDGGVLTLGQNTEVRVEAGLITLVTGSAHYVSGATNVTVGTPGGTITLLGTDIDVVSDGTDSTVRVRDGAILLVGAVSGSVNLVAGDMGETISGVVSSVTNGTATYTAHEDTVTQQIDWLSASQTGEKVAPYLVDAPYISTERLVPGQILEIGLRFNKSVTISGGAPSLSLFVNGQSRTASLISGSGTNELIFGYTLQAGDAGISSLTVTGFNDNGATLTNGSKIAVTNIPDTVLTLSTGITDVTAPSGYAVAFLTDPVNDSNQATAQFEITGAEVGANYNYTISSSGGAATITGNGSIATATQTVTADMTSLDYGTLTISLTLTDTASNTGVAATGTVTKTSLPILNYVAQRTSLVDDTNYTFMNTAIGTPAADRLVIVMVQTMGNGSEVTDITVGGVPAVIHVQGYANGHWQNTAIASVALPTGANATVNVTTANTAWLCQVFVYSATNLNSMTPTGVASGPDGAFNGQVDLTIPVSQGGFIIGGAHVEISASNPPIWTQNNALAVTDAIGDDETYSGQPLHYYAAHSENLSANANYPVQFRNNNDNFWFGAAMASWR